MSILPVKHSYRVMQVSDGCHVSLEFSKKFAHMTPGNLQSSADQCRPVQVLVDTSTWTFGVSQSSILLHAVTKIHAAEHAGVSQDVSSDI